MDDAWSVQDAKAHLSEVLRKARAGEPQRIGLAAGACMVISEEAWVAAQGVSLGAWLVESAPRIEGLELPPRGSKRPPPFEGDGR